MEVDERLEKLERSHRRLKYVLAGVTVVALALAGLAAVQERSGDAAGTVRAREFIIPAEDGSRQVYINRNLLQIGKVGQKHVEITPTALKLWDGDNTVRARIELVQNAVQLELKGPNYQRRLYYSGGMLNVQREGRELWIDPQRTATGQ